MKVITVPYKTENFFGSFNATWAAGHTFEEFAAEHKHNPLSEAELREAYNLCHEVTGATPKTAEIKSDEPEKIVPPKLGKPAVDK